jgi:UDP-glucose:(glucosyl)LPS alpha-1,2-glucosyltransferase
MSLRIVPSIETNELSKNAMGGTELMLRALHSRLPDKYKKEFQIIPTRVRTLDKDKKKILWVHDLVEDTESEHLLNADLRKRFSKIVFVSNWQATTYHKLFNIPYSEFVVLKNAIVPIPEAEKPDGVIRMIYHTTPHRGLNILVPVFKELTKKYGNKIHLDVYSSFKIYGWEQRDRDFEDLFDLCRQDPNITYHGAVSNDEIRTALQRSHIFAYPSTWPETSCIAAIEAMSAKCVVVCSSLGALPETTGNLSLMYHYDENLNIHANRFYNTLDQAIGQINTSDMNLHLKFQKQYVDNFFNWDFRIKEWEYLLEGLRNE